MMPLQWTNAFVYMKYFQGNDKTLKTFRRRIAALAKAGEVFTFTAKIVRKTAYNTNAEKRLSHNKWVYRISDYEIRTAATGSIRSFDSEEEVSSSRGNRGHGVRSRVRDLAVKVEEKFLLICDGNF